MSARALNWAWQQTPRTTTEKLVLAALADRADDDGECFPSLSWIVEKCKPITKPTAKRAVAELAAQGFIAKVDRRRRGDGTLGTWLYRLPIDQSAQVIPGQPERTSEPHQSAPVSQPERTSDPAETFYRDEVSTDVETGGRPRDAVWDTLVDLFGDVPVNAKNAHGKRNAAVRDLKALGATPAAIEAAAKAWTRLYEHATLTDVALATHYPQLAKTAGVREGEPPKRVVCDECETGGGFHAVGCSKIPVAA